MGKKESIKGKTIKRKLNLKRVFFLVCFLLIVFLVVKFSLKIKVKEIYVDGNKFVTDKDIINSSGLDKNTFFLKFSARKVCNEVVKNPFIETCKIKRDLSFAVRIVVTENAPVLLYFPESKVILSNGDKVNLDSQYGIPTLISVVPEEVLDKFIVGLNNVNSDIIRSVSEIEYAPSVNNKGEYIDKERFMLSMNDGNIVYINIRNIEVLNNYTKIYASIGDKKGYYNLDSDFENYYFKEF